MQNIPFDYKMSYTRSRRHQLDAPPQRKYVNKIDAKGMGKVYYK